MTRQTLQQAFALARSQGYQCLFLDEGPALYEMLRAVLSGGAIGDWDSLYASCCTALHASNSPARLPLLPQA